MTTRPNQIPKDAVLLIPEPEDEQSRSPYGVAPGYYNPQQMLELLDHHRHNADAIHFIADMLETGNPEDDEDQSCFRGGGRIRGIIVSTSCRKLAITF